MRCIFSHQSGPHTRSRRNFTTILNGFALHETQQHFLPSKFNTHESETLTRWRAKTLKPQHKTNFIFQICIPQPNCARIQCRRPSQPKTQILTFSDMHSAAKLRRESNAVDQVSRKPIYYIYIYIDIHIYIMLYNEYVIQIYIYIYIYMYIVFCVLTYPPTSSSARPC